MEQVVGPVLLGFFKSGVYYFGNGPGMNGLTVVAPHTREQRLGHKSSHTHTLANNPPRLDGLVLVFMVLTSTMSLV